VLAEVEQVLSRKKFHKVLSLDKRQRFLHSLRSVAQLVSIASQIQLCRDPRDDKFLELAVDGNADGIITGDEDLLAHDPFGNIRILTPKQFLELRNNLSNLKKP
jgi:putative PIN family toxin of toxin-antitoxin system